MRRPLRPLLASALLGLFALAASAKAAPGEMIALGVAPNANVLFEFAADTPGSTTAVPVTGLGASTLVGIDHRPANGLLYGLGVNGNATTLFRIDPASGAAAIVGFTTISTITGATAFGIDFNPVSDRLRVVDDLPSSGESQNNFRLHPDTGKIAGIDTRLDLGAIPGGGGMAAIAHDRNVAGAKATTLFAILAAGDRLARIGGVDGTPSPNGGVVSDVGPLGVDVTTSAGLDIDPDSGAAFAVFRVAGVSGLYRVNLGTGAATLVGKIGSGAVNFGGLAIEPSPTAGSPPPPLLPPLPAVEPKLESLSLRPRAFATVNAGGAVLSKIGKAPIGTTVSYTVSTPTTTAFAVERKSIGRKVGAACEMQSRGNRGRKPCPLFMPVKGGFSHSGSAGANSFRFTGRPGGKALKPGAYRLVARVGSSTRRTSFRVVPARSGQH